MKRSLGPLVLVALVALFGLGSSTPAVDVAAGWSANVDPWVLDTVEREGRVEALVVLERQADLSDAARLAGKKARGRWVFERLTEVARESQRGLLAALAAAEVEHRPFWVANMVWVDANLEALRMLAERADVARIAANPRVRADLAFRGVSGGAGPDAGVEPNIDQTGAPAVFWANGFTGQGIVIAGADTGVEWDHAALRDSYRGWDGQAADHNYNWHDAIHSGGGVCGPNSQVPCDDDDHGTLTMGIAVGDDGVGNQIGMAPGAEWIACRNMDQGVGTPATYSECYEFFIAPTDLAGQNPDPSRAPHVINNSWVCPPDEGCTDPNILLTVVENARAAGIAVVASAGNDGLACSTIQYPSAIYDAAWTVGSINIKGELSAFSSRGPVTVDGSNRLKPDVVAPGEDVRTAKRGGGYQEFSGTSISGPHVAGMAALMMSAESCLVGDVGGMEATLKKTARHWTTSETCGGIPAGESPNNSYGFGAIRSVLPTELACSPDLAVAGSCPGLVTLSLSRLTPGAQVAVVGALAAGETAVPGGNCAGTELGIDEPLFSALTTADGTGQAVLEGDVTGGSCGALVQVLDLADCTTSAVAALPR